MKPPEIRFNLTAFKALLTAAEAAVIPSLLLVGDEGVYAMIHIPADVHAHIMATVPDAEKLFATSKTWVYHTPCEVIFGCYAIGCHPKEDKNWSETKNKVWPKGDGVIELPAKRFRDNFKADDEDCAQRGLRLTEVVLRMEQTITIWTKGVKA